MKCAWRGTASGARVEEDEIPFDGQPGTFQTEHIRAQPWDTWSSLQIDDGRCLRVRLFRCQDCKREPDRRCTVLRPSRQETALKAAGVSGGSAKRQFASLEVALRPLELVGNPARLGPSAGIASQHGHQQQSAAREST
jgi:hypothetical protein